MIVVTGGAKSGKSSFAEQKAKSIGNKVLYIATAIPFDDEMKVRIKRHREVRPITWETYEGFLNLPKIIVDKSNDFDCILLDCVTILITNLIFHYNKSNNIEEAEFNVIEKLVLEEMKNIVNACKTIKSEIIFVTNELGCGIVPENKLSRHFRDIAGNVNQFIAKNANEVYISVSGIPVKIK